VGLGPGEEREEENDDIGFLIKTVLLNSRLPISKAARGE